MATTQRVYIWELPVRITHWVNALAITALSITGFYIGAPFIHSTADGVLPMATMRFIHFCSGYAFAASVLVRIYWWFAGNMHARLNQFIPTTMDRIQNTIQTGLFYAFMEDEIPHSPGHTGLAGLSYCAVFAMFVYEIISGFAMLSIAQGGGMVNAVMGAWILAIFDPGTVRMLHHIVMWFIWIFVTFHVYIGWHNDVVERNGLISSIFSGYKFFGSGH
ncbi:MAG TPA: Ni/Fe-hydrogenase, b-type cytochrome subunit [Dissulfurispiraceae bacterium]|nr:Ni/Fe-hydrogenase, b-type cytochrome subunit [Dissulfurispiraceae bacterium]